MKYPSTPSTQAVGLGFARPPLRGCGLLAETRFELETPGQHTFGTLPGREQCLSLLSRRSLSAVSGCDFRTGGQRPPLQNSA